MPDCYCLRLVHAPHRHASDRCPDLPVPLSAFAPASPPTIRYSDEEDHWHGGIGDA